MKLDQDIFMGIGNLHDVFLNASLIKKHMDESPLLKGEEFLVSDRGRLERIWVAFLYVLIEAWESSQMKRIRKYIASKVSLDELTTLIQERKEDGSIAKMREARHYMAHRDKREYWDIGRLSVLGQLTFHVKLHQAFSRVLLTAMQEITKQKDSKP